MTCGTVTKGRNNAIFHDLVVSRKDIISVCSVETPVITKAKPLPGGCARVTKYAAIGAKPSEDISKIVATTKVNLKPINLGPK